MNTGDTAWLLTSTALVMLMTAPGLALFYGGLVSPRNYLSTLMHSFFLLCLISVQWVLFGYTLAFGPDRGGWLGGLDFLFFTAWARTRSRARPSLTSRSRSTRACSR